ncbi:MAG: hypothetical protein JWO80_483 [Bryobacterales bacterium]|nr:hypothetical protein [Bryobacterales bacterium]
MWKAYRSRGPSAAVVAVTCVAALLLQPLPAQDQPPPAALRIVILDGDEAINNIRQRTAREPIVQVEDENHRPVAGAAVIFVLPNDGAGATFVNGARTLSVVTDSKGQAVAHGLRPNNVPGQYQIRVDASYRGATSRATINQSNVAGSAAGVGLSTKMLIGLGVVAGVVAATSAWAATRGNNNTAGNGTVTGTPIVLTPGTGTVGPPH